jgi:hypothetical protein
VLNTNRFGDQALPEASVLSNGQVAVVWGAADGDNDGADFGLGLFQARFDAAISGDEDSEIRLALSALIRDADSETFDSIVISGIPSGAILSDGVMSTSASSVDVSQGGWDLDNLTITPPQDSIDSFELTLTTTTIEDSGDTSTPVVQTLFVDVSPQSDNSVFPGVSVAVDDGSTVAISGSDLTTGVTDVDSQTALTYSPSVLFDSSTIDVDIHDDHYHWDDANGGGKFDLKTAGVTYVTDSGSAIPSMNNVFEFNGLDGGEIDKGLLKTLAKNGSIEIWIKPDSLSGKKIILDVSDDNEGYVLYQEDDSIVLEILDEDDYGGGVKNQSTKLIASGLVTSEFNQIVFAIDASTGSLGGESDKADVQLFLNGELKDQALDVPTIEDETRFDAWESSRETRL